MVEPVGVVVATLVVSTIPELVVFGLELDTATERKIVAELVGVVAVTVARVVVVELELGVAPKRTIEAEVIGVVVSALLVVGVAELVVSDGTWTPDVVYVLVVELELDTLTEVLMMAEAEAAIAVLNATIVPVTDVPLGARTGVDTTATKVALTDNVPKLATFAPLAVWATPALKLPADDVSE